jgi:SAM-dependent methyltransferase
MPTTGERSRGPLALADGESSALRRAAASLGALERAHLLLRFASAPWAGVVEALEPGGALLDVGCGPGLLAHLLGRAGYAGTYLGLDPDTRKIARAQRWLPETPGRRFEVGSIDAAPVGRFSQLALVDVLYLVPPAGRDAFLARAAEALRPGGLFVALTSGGGPAWKRTLDRLQEKVAVGLGMTRGAAVATCDGAEIAERLRAASLREVSVRDVGRGHLHGFELVAGRKTAP